MPVQLPKLPAWKPIAPPPPGSPALPAPWGGSWYGGTWGYESWPGWQFRLVWSPGGHMATTSYHVTYPLGPGWYWAKRKANRLLILGPGPWMPCYRWNDAPPPNVQPHWGKYYGETSPYPPVNPPLIEAPMSSHPYYGPMRWS